ISTSQRQWREESGQVIFERNRDDNNNDGFRCHDRGQTQEADPENDNVASEAHDDHSSAAQVYRIGIEGSAYLRGRGRDRQES
ncbi:hypothetical protein BGZ98_005649, partial [Dissophora globulifera]